MLFVQILCLHPAASAAVLANVNLLRHDVCLYTRDHAYMQYLINQYYRNNEAVYSSLYGWRAVVRFNQIIQIKIMLVKFVNSDVGLMGEALGWNEGHNSDSLSTFRMFSIRRPIAVYVFFH